MSKVKIYKLIVSDDHKSVIILITLANKYTIKNFALIRSYNIYISKNIFHKGRTFVGRSINYNLGVIKRAYKPHMRLHIFYSKNIRKTRSTIYRIKIL